MTYSCTRGRRLCLYSFLIIMLGFEANVKLPTKKGFFVKFRLSSDHRKNQIRNVLPNFFDIISVCSKREKMTIVSKQGGSSF
jgi:hypothetical protein